MKKNDQAPYSDTPDLLEIDQLCKVQVIIITFGK